MSTTGKTKNYKKHKYIKTKQHTPEQPTDHRRNQKGNKIKI